MIVRYSVIYGVTSMTAAGFRRIALGLEGVEEYPHAGLPAFRVGGRKFASLASQAEGYSWLAGIKDATPLTLFWRRPRAKIGKRVGAEHEKIGPGGISLSIDRQEDQRT
jgi:hypothetical protein